MVFGEGQRRAVRVGDDADYVCSIPMPPALKDLSKAKVMLITDGGLVPKGNPDKIQGSAATRWGSYKIEGCDDLKAEDYEISHGGYDPQFVRQDPDRLVPLDAMRELEREGVIGKLHDEFISTVGASQSAFNTRRMGREMAEQVKQLGIDAVILDFDLRNQHPQRRCDHDRVGKSRHPDGSNHGSSPYRKDGRFQPHRSRQRHRSCGRRCQRFTGTRKGSTAQTGGKGAGDAAVGKENKP